MAVLKPLLTTIDWIVVSYILGLEYGTFCLYDRTCESATDAREAGTSQGEGRVVSPSVSPCPPPRRRPSRKNPRCRLSSHESQQSSRSSPLGTHPFLHRTENMRMKTFITIIRLFFGHPEKNQGEKNSKLKGEKSTLNFNAY